MSVAASYIEYEFYRELERLGAPRWACRLEVEEFPGFAEVRLRAEAFVWLNGDWQKFGHQSWIDAAMPRSFLTAAACRAAESVVNGIERATA